MSLSTFSRMKTWQKFCKRIRLRKVKCREYSSDILKNGLSSTQVMYGELGDPVRVLNSNVVKLPDKLKETEVLVRMKMAPINPSDINMIEGTYHIRPELPAVCGNEGVGEVLEVGEGVARLKPGDWVIPAATGFGTWRTYAVSDQENLQQVPNDIPALSAATIMVNPSTAYRMLKDFVCLHEGDTIIQNGSNSAVGQAVIQLAKVWGLQTINIVRDRPDLDMLTGYLKDLGATHVVTEEFCRTPPMKELIKSIGKPPKLALNTVGGQSATGILRHLANKGVMVTYGGMSRKPVTIPTGALIFNRVKLTGYWNAKWLQENAENPERLKMFDEMFDLVRDCKLLPPASDLIPLSQYQEAVKSSQEGYKGNKKILVMNEDEM